MTTLSCHLALVRFLVELHRSFRFLCHGLVWVESVIVPSCLTGPFAAMPHGRFEPEVTLLSV